jgi:hypothetical protein
MRWLNFLGNRMGGLQGSRRRQLARLKLELAKAWHRLDELEKRSYRRPDEIANTLSENAETRFAARVASGMSKIRSPSNVP